MDLRTIAGPRCFPALVATSAAKQRATSGALNWLIARRDASVLEGMVRNQSWPLSRNF